jgi:uncharacterized protein CbrC (UPF0167 family)
VTPDQAIAWILASSDYADREHDARLAYWRDGYAAGLAAAASAYDDGYTDAMLGLKHIQHDIVTEMRHYLTAWNGLRQHFGRPRPGEKQPCRPAGAA